YQQLLIRHQIAGIPILFHFIDQKEGLAEPGAPSAEVALLLIYGDLPFNPLPKGSKILPSLVKGHLDRFRRADGLAEQAGQTLLIWLRLGHEPGILLPLSEVDRLWHCLFCCLTHIFSHAFASAASAASGSAFFSTTLISKAFIGQKFTHIPQNTQRSW